MRDSLLGWPTLQDRFAAGVSCWSLDICSPFFSSHLPSSLALPAFLLSFSLIISIIIVPRCIFTLQTPQRSHYHDEFRPTGPTQSCKNYKYSTLLIRQRTASRRHSKVGFLFFLFVDKNKHKQQQGLLSFCFLCSRLPQGLHCDTHFLS